MKVKLTKAGAVVAVAVATGINPRDRGVNIRRCKRCKTKYCNILVGRLLQYNTIQYNTKQNEHIHNTYP